MFSIGEKVLIAPDLESPEKIQEHTVTKVVKDTIHCDNSSELVFYAAFAWPARVRPQLEEIMRKRRILKKAYDDSMGLVYELKNQIARKEV